MKIYDAEQRLAFSQWLSDNHDKLANILWTDEAYLHLNGDISRYHCRIWSCEKPTNYLTKSLHPQKVCVWFGFSAKFSLTPFFFGSTVNQDNYLDMLQSHVRPQLAQKRKLASTIFMQDGAPPHFATEVRISIEHFQLIVISRGCDIVWPSRSPDINPLDYWFGAT